MSTFNFAKWPVKAAGPAPQPFHVDAAFTLLKVAKGTIPRGDGEILAVAAYLRPQHDCVHPDKLATALGAILGLSTVNPRNNVINQQLGATEKGRARFNRPQYVDWVNRGCIKLMPLGRKVLAKHAPQALAAIDALNIGKPLPMVEPETAKPVEPKPVKVKAPRKPKATKAPAVTTDAAEPVEATPTPTIDETASVAA